MAEDDISLYADRALALINEHVPFSRELFERCLPYLGIRRTGRREFLLRAGEQEEHLYLVVDGLVRKFAQTAKSEKTLQLATEGHLIHSELSYHYKIPSQVSLQTLEPSLLLFIHRDRQEALHREVPEMQEKSVRLLERLFIEKDERQLLQLSHTVRERFLTYIDSHPEMLRRVPQKILASYLEIKPETFSRLKRLLRPGV